MENLNRFNPNRLKFARLYEGMTTSELANHIGVSKQMVSQYENGKSAPSLETLMRIIGVLGFPREYFTLPDQGNMKIGETFFRSALTTNKITKESQIVKLKSLSEFYSMLEEYIDFPSLNLPKFDAQRLEQLDIEQIAMETREFLGLGEEPIRNMVFLLEKNGIIVSSLKTSSGKVDAFSHSQIVNGIERCFIILGSDKSSAVRRQFDAAHEYGHLILHKDYINLDEITKEEYREMEKQADQFAAAFLLPKNAFIKDLIYPNNIDEYIELKKKWRVSIGAMIIRAYHLELINYNQYQYLMRKMNQKGWKTREPLDDVITVATPTVLRKAVDLLLLNNVLTSKEILQKLAFSQDKAEDLLNLNKGTLAERKDKEEKVIALNIRNSNKAGIGNS